MNTCTIKINNTKKSYSYPLPLAAHLMTLFILIVTNSLKIIFMSFKKEITYTAPPKMGKLFPHLSWIKNMGLSYLEYT